MNGYSTKVILKTINTSRIQWGFIVNGYNQPKQVERRLGKKKLRLRCTETKLKIKS